MSQLLAWHLARLVDFSGRQTRKPFWLWTAIVVALAFTGMALAVLPAMIGIFSRIEDFAAEHPDQVTRTVGPGSYSIQIHGHHPELMPDFSMMLGGMTVISLTAVLLLAASVARRLHDSGRSGVWGLIPVTLLLVGMGGMARLFGSFTERGEPPLGLIFGMFFVNVIYLVTLGVLIMFLAQPGSLAENRFGLPPSGEPPI